MKFNKFFLLVYILFISLTKLNAQNQIPIPELKRPVTDLVGVLSDSEIQIIEKKILDLEKEKGSQIAVLIIPTTGEESIEEYSMRVVEKWKLGRKGIDDGVLFLIATADRKMRIEVGYGLEGAIPDAKAKQILDDFVKPYFKQGNFYKGIDTGVDLLIKLIRNEPLPEPKKENDNTSIWYYIIFIVISLFLVFAHFGVISNFYDYSKTLGNIMLILDIGLNIFLFFLIQIEFFWIIIFITLIPLGIISCIVIPSSCETSSSSSSSSDSYSWRSSSSSSSSDSYSGGGGSFGGGGASSSW